MQERQGSRVIITTSANEKLQTAAYYIKSALAAGFSACMAETLTIPLDTAKVRLQMQSKECCSNVMGDSMKRVSTFDHN